MLASLLILAENSSSTAWRVALAFLLVIIGVALVYVLVRAGRVLKKVEKLVEDLDTELVPVLQRASTTVDEVNAELGKVNDITASVAEMTERVDAATRAVENAVSSPAKKAAAFTSGVGQTVSSFFGRRGGGDADEWAAEHDWAAAESSTDAGPAPSAAAPAGAEEGMSGDEPVAGSWAPQDAAAAAEAPEAGSSADAGADEPPAGGPLS
jgi:uncharacterized protein YoxC